MPKHIIFDDNGEGHVKKPPRRRRKDAKCPVGKRWNSRAKKCYNITGKKMTSIAYRGGTIRVLNNTHEARSNARKRFRCRAKGGKPFKISGKTRCYVPGK
jgi:hypothetical protein